MLQSYGIRGLRLIEDNNMSDLNKDLNNMSDLNKYNTSCGKKMVGLDLRLIED